MRNSEVIDKMYELAGCEKQTYSYSQWAKEEGTFSYDGLYPQAFFDSYPPFTARKQLELVKIMFQKGIYYDCDKNPDVFWFHYTDDIENAHYREFNEAIAEFIISIWQHLTEAEQSEIKEILCGMKS